MNKRALVYLGMASATLALAFLYVQNQTSGTVTTPATIPDSPSSDAAQALPSVSVLGGKVGGEPIRLQVKVGDSAQFLVFTDEDDELQVSNLGQSVSLPARQTTKVTIAVDQAGSFEMELQQADAILGVIEAQP